jgi:hypothetical protein
MGLLLGGGCGETGDERASIGVVLRVRKIILLFRGGHSLLWFLIQVSERVRHLHYSLSTEKATFTGSAGSSI